MEGKKRILLVDDEEMVLEILCQFLERSYEVVTASNGEEAIELCEEQWGSFQAVITDWEMPRKNGRELVEYLRQKDSSIPIMVMSGGIKEEDVQSLKSKGRIPVLRKPFVWEELLRELERW